jgi:transposase
MFEPNAAGIDIGAREIFVAVPPDRDAEPVRKCETSTEDLHRMADWQVRCGVTTAAMESTRVYWIPVYDVLEKHGIKLRLVNPGNMKNVPESAPIFMSASGFSICTRWGSCTQRSGRMARCAQYVH